MADAIKVAEVLDTGLYLPRNIYNMDECGFDLSATRRTRRVGPRNASIKAQTSLSTNTHITVIAAISTQDAPVPPFLIYPGKYSMSDWLQVMDEQPKQMAVMTESGYSNSFMTIRWITDCFDPATKSRAAGSLRLLFLDGPDIHTSVEFLQTCWARKIICIILPANMSGIFQPLDVDLFAHLKREYHRQIDDYQQGSGAVSVPKSFFYRWHQRAWDKAATSRQIRSAWSKSFLYPRAAVTTGLLGLASEPQAPQAVPETPRCNRTLHALDNRLRLGEISPTSSARKVRKALEEVLAQKVLLERDLERQNAAAELDRVGRSRGKRTRYPMGFVFDQQYEEDHAEELAERRREEEGRKRARRTTALAIPHAESSNSAQRRAEAVPTEDESIAWLASLADEL